MTSKGNNMNNSVLLVVRRISFFVGLLSILGLLGACGQDSGSSKKSAAKDGGIILAYGDESVRATTAVRSVNAMMLGQSETFHVTIIGGWVDKNPDAPSFGLITTRLTLRGESDSSVAKGQYALEESDYNLSGAMTAALVLEGATMGLPRSLVATAGELKVNAIKQQENSLKSISLSFDGTFKNSRDDADNTEYKLSGHIDVPAK